MSHIVSEKKEEKKQMSRADIIKARDARREKDNDLVTGIFRYLEHTGGTLSFRFKKYADDPYREYHLTDGQRYQLPRMVARHLNKDVYYVKYQHLDKQLGDMGVEQSGINVGKSRFDTGTSKPQEKIYAQNKMHRCEFRSLEFMDDDLDLVPSGIIPVISKF